MKKIITLGMVILVFAFFSGCERTEKAIELYKKVKDDAKEKAKGAKDSTQEALEKKLKDVTGTPDREKQIENPPQKDNTQEPKG